MDDSDMEWVETEEEFVGDTRLVTILNDAQDVTFDRDNGIEMCRQLISQVSQENHKALNRLVEQFRNYVEPLLIIKVSAYPNVNTIIQFLVELLADLSRNEDETFVKNQVLFHVLSHFRANSDDVRLRVCEIVHKFLQALNDKSTPSPVDLNNNQEVPIEEAYIEEKLFLKMRECLVERMRDSNINVQMEAISASAFLQSPEDSYCPIINGYMFLLRHDSYQLIRIHILDYLVLNKTTYSFLKDELIHDTSRDVRSKVMRVVLKKVANKFVDARFRRTLIEVALTDDNMALLKELVAKWLTKKAKKTVSLMAANDKVSTLQFIIDLNLGSVWYPEEKTNSMVSKEQKLFKLMKMVFEQQTIFDSITEFNKTSSKLQFESLEAAFHFKSLAYYCFESNQIARFNSISNVQSNMFYFDVADKLSFIDQITAPVDALYYQLFEASYFLDSQNFEEKILHFVTFVLSSPTSCYKPDLLIYQAILTKLNLSKTRHEVLNLVWNYYSLNKDGDEDQVKKSLGIFFHCVAQLTKQEYELSLRDRPANTDEAGLGARSLNHNETLPKFLFKHMLLNTIQSQDPSVRAMTLRIIGIFARLDIEFIEMSFSIFVNAIAHDYPQVVVESQKVFFNILMVYSSEFRRANKDVVDTMIRVLQMQMDCLDDNVRFVSFEGFAKLLLNNSIANDEILFKILLTFSSMEGLKKTDESKVELKACLSVFLFEYFRKHPGQLTKMTEKYIRYGLQKGVSLKPIANYAFYWTNSCEKPLLKFSIINFILDFMLANMDDFRVLQRLSDALLEFDIRQSEMDDVDPSQEDPEEYEQQLSKISTKFQSIVNKLKGEKWKLSREVELKELAQKVAKFTERQNKSKTGIKRARPISMISITSDEVPPEGESADIYQFQSARASSRPKVCKQ